MFEFRMLRQFSETYDSLSDAQAAQVDQAIIAVLENPTSAASRVGRIEGDGTGQFDGAWIVPFVLDGEPYSLYWDYYDAKTIALYGVVATP